MRGCSKIMAAVFPAATYTTMPKLNKTAFAVLWPSPPPHGTQELVKVLPSALTALNVRLDGALASFGIHPGRPGLSDTEFLAATQLLE